MKLLQLNIVADPSLSIFCAIDTSIFYFANGIHIHPPYNENTTT